ncbi:MAG: hypothetical protein H0T84_08850, partial [Tatlockia sp.]|nr:hypothetical protein [Tatlockia sp.]
MFTAYQHKITFLFSILTSSLSFTCLQDLAADKTLELLLLQSTQQQAATLSNLPNDSVDILKSALIAKNKALITQLLTLETKKLTDHTSFLSMINTATLSPNGNYALTGGDNGALVLWNLSTLEYKKLRGHTSSIT